VGPAKVRRWLRGQERPRLLVVRNDGLGDFLLTLPLVAALKRHLPQAHVTVLLSAALAGLAPLLPDIDAAIADEGVLLKRHRGRFPRRERRTRQAALLQAVRAGNFDAALLPYAEASTARLVQRARVPIRVGPLRRAFFWRFNAHFRRTRRGSHAAEYALNLGYLECLGLPTDFVRPRLVLPDGLELPAPAGAYAVLHPHKRSGTALTWPLGRFVALARRLAAAGLAVVAVGDAPDRPVLERAFVADPDVRIETGLSLAQLTALIAGARLFAGNSSGPLHLAGLAGTPHVALYPQDRVSAPERWRTLPAEGAPADFRSYLLASRFPKDCVVCEGERCAYFNCVASLDVDAVWRALQGWGLKLSAGRQ
jgi:ADP-heptose:LPS heptosyltransferase